MSERQGHQAGDAPSPVLLNPPKPPHRRLLLVVLFLGALYLAFEGTGLRENFDLNLLQRRFLDNKLSGTLVFVLLFSLGNLIQIPGWLFLAAAVLALGRFWGGTVTYVAAIVSCALTFATLRLIGGTALRELKNGLARRLLAQLDAHPIRSVLLLRVLLQTVPVLNYTLALSGVRFREYMIGTVLGLPLPIAVYCLFFETLAQLLHVR